MAVPNPPAPITATCWKATLVFLMVCLWNFPIYVIENSYLPCIQTGDDYKIYKVIVANTIGQINRQLADLLNFLSFICNLVYSWRGNV